MMETDANRLGGHRDLVQTPVAEIKSIYNVEQKAADPLVNP